MKLYCTKRKGQSQSEEAIALLRLAFGLNYTEKMPKIKKTSNGKPYFHDRPDIHFSLSHSKAYILCALSSNPVGVDIESERVLKEKTIDFFCSPEELKQFDPLDLWVLKESYIKLFGYTLTQINKIFFTRVGDRIIAPDKTVISQLYQTDLYRAAVSTFDNCLPDSIEHV